MNTDAIPFVLVDKQRKLSFRALDYRLAAESQIYAYKYLLRLISECSCLHTFVLC